MRDILFLAHRIPFPPDRGDKIRSFHMLKGLAKLGRLHVACFADDEDEAQHIHALRDAIGPSLGDSHVEVRRADRWRAGIEALRERQPLSLTLFRSGEMRDFVARLLTFHRIDAIVAFSGQMAQFVPHRLPSRFVMDFVDMDSAKFAEYGAARSPLAPLYRREARLLAAFERATAARADVSLFVTPEEAALFRRRTRLDHADIRALHNGVNVDHFDPAADFPRLTPEQRGDGTVILFTGQMDYRPNVEAVRVFAEGPFRAIRARRPDARFVIAGRDPAKAVQALAGPHVTVTGAVRDMRSWLAAADVVVAPLGIARGVQNKVLEAMAMAKPVVASPAAYEGIEAKPGRDLIVADRPAGPIADLLDDRARAQALGEAARKQVEARYRWSACLAPLDEIIGPEPDREAA